VRAKGISFCAALCVLVCSGIALAQEPFTIPACESTAPPKYVLLVHQEFPAGKAAERQKLHTESARDFDRLKIPNCWIEMQAWTGAPNALYFDAFDSYEQMARAHDFLAHAYAKHPELPRTVQQIAELMTSTKTVVAVRRDDLGYRAKTIDLSKVRYMRVVIVRVRQGHENEFAEAYQMLAAAYELINSPNPWMVYQVDTGIPRPAFLIFVPIREMAEMDKLLANATAIRSAEGEAATRMQQIARDAYESSEVQIYVVSPQMSHVLPAFAAGDPAFWIQKQEPPPSASPPAPPKKKP
jgi:hypothetical protein